MILRNFGSSTYTSQNTTAVSLYSFNKQLLVVYVLCVQP